MGDVDDIHFCLKIAKKIRHYVDLDS
uniref:Uncharacterized protein n=1 Tax=Nymphaea colorata TaxID=210225 RepID=A0A5K1GN31_9MAGN